MISAHDIGRFSRAVRSLDLQTVRSMAAADPGLVRATDPECFGATPLIRAVETDDRAVVDLLLELGAEIDQRSDWWAGGFGVLDGASDGMAEHLLARGAVLTAHAAARLGKVRELREMLDRDSSLVSARGGDGQTPLHFARTEQIAELLLQRGARVDALDLDHASTPAQWLGGTRPEVVRYLVSRGARTDPFMAARTGDLELLEREVGSEAEGVKVRVTRGRFAAAPPAAGHVYLYTIGEGCGLLHAAAATGQGGSVRWLAAHGADVGARGGYDWATPLHVAAWNDKPVAAEALLEAGAEVDAPSGPQHRNSPLGWAIVGGSPGAARVLLKGGAEIRDHHRQDASRGVAGAFREFNPRRPLSAWREVEELIAGA